MIAAIVLGHEALARAQTSILCICEVCIDVLNLLSSSFSR